MKKNILTLIFSLLAIVQPLFAQNSSTADLLYKQGVSFMKTMTIVSQNKAISAFEKAKIAYDSAEKKKICDDQIATCKKIKQQLVASNNKPKPNPNPKPVEPTPTTSTPDTIPEQSIDKVRIVLNPTEISMSAKGGKYIEIFVECDDEDWKVESCPDWLSYTSSSTKLLVKAERNKDKHNERAGVIVITAGKKKAELVVKQSKPNIFGI
jgi:hypothetical protein